MGNLENMDIKNSYTLKMKRISSPDSPEEVLVEWTGRGSLKDLLIGQSFKMLVPASDNKARIIATRPIEDVIVVSNTIFDLITLGGYKFRIEIVKSPPKYFN